MNDRKRKLKDSKKEEIIYTLWCLMKVKLQREIPNTPCEIIEAYKQLSDNSKNYIWNDVASICDVPHTVAYKYFVNTWSRQAHNSSVIENRKEFIPQIIAAFIQSADETDQLATVWQSVKQYCAQQNWHTAQSYAFTYNYVKRLERTGRAIDIERFFHDREYRE